VRSLCFEDLGKHNFHFFWPRSKEIMFFNHFDCFRHVFCESLAIEDIWLAEEQDFAAACSQWIFQHFVAFLFQRRSLRSRRESARATRQYSSRILILPLCPTSKKSMMEATQKAEKRKKERNKTESVILVLYEKVAGSSPAWPPNLFLPT